MNEYSSVGGVAFAHDDNGNRTQDGKFDLVFDYKNRLVAVFDRVTGLPVSQYFYFADGRRSTKRLFDPLAPGNFRTTVYRYDGSKVVEEREGALVSTYVWNPIYVDELVQFERGAERFWAHQNVRADVVAVVLFPLQQDKTGSLKSQVVDRSV